MADEKYTTEQARMWLQCFTEAEQRKSDKSLPMEARIRSAGTCSMLLRAADNGGETFESMSILAENTGSASHG